MLHYLKRELSILAQANIAKYLTLLISLSIISISYILFQIEIVLIITSYFKIYNIQMPLKSEGVQLSMPIKSKGVQLSMPLKPEGVQLSMPLKPGGVHFVVHQDRVASEIAL